MKKTLIAIIAVMLVVVLSLTLFACNKDKNKPAEQEEEPIEATGKELKANELGTNAAVTQQVLNFAEQYLTNNATSEKNVSTAMAKAMTKQFVGKNSTVKSVTVNYVKGSGAVEDHYSIKIVYTKTNDWYVYDGAADLVARVAETGVHAGYAAGTGAKEIAEAKNDEELAKVYNAFLHTVKKAVDDATAFGNDYKAAAIGEDAIGVKFGGTVEGVFTMNYGVGENQIGPLSYGLKVYGTLGYDAADTEVAIEFIDELNNKTLGGLYYKDSTLYLALDFQYEADKRNADGKLVDASGAVIEDANGKLLKDKVPAKETKTCKEKLMLDKADLNAIFGGMLGASFSAPECYDLSTGETHDAHVYEGGYCTNCGAKEVVASTDKPFYEGANQPKLSTAIGSMISGNSAGTISTVVKLVLGLLKGTYTNLGDGVTRYIYNLDIGSLLDTVKANFGKEIEEALSSMINDMGITFLADLKLASFKGIGGVLSLAFDVKGTGDDSLLAGAEIAYNANQQDFRWNADDDVAKVYGPINGAITVKDFAIGAQPINIDKISGTYEAFSPLNVEATCDLTLAGYSDNNYNGTYAVVARSAANPFDMESAEAELILTKKNDGVGEKVLHVYFHNVEDEDDMVFHVTTYLDNNFNGIEDGVYYDTIAYESDLGGKLYEEFFKPLVAEGSISDLSPISDYVWELIHQFTKTVTVDEAKADLIDAATAAKSAIDELVAKKAKTETKTVDGKEVTEYMRRDGKIVYETIADSAWMRDIKTNAKNNIQGIVDGLDAALAAIDDNAEINDKTDAKLDLIAGYKADVAYYLSNAKADFKAQVKKEGKEDSVMDGFNIMSLATNITALKDLFVGADNKPAKPSVLDYSFAADDENAPFITANLDYNTYNDVIDVLLAGIPKLDKFDATAAKVTVHMNDAGYKGKLVVKVEYPGNAPEYVVDVALDSGNCLDSRDAYDADGNEYTEYFLKSNCNLAADVTIKTPEKSYVYKATIAIAGWDKNNGTIDVSFKESDGANKTSADDEFVNLHIVQKWATEEGKDVYRGFTVTATLRSRKADGSGMNEAHVYNLTGSYDATEKMYDLTLVNEDGSTITIGFGKGNGRIDYVNTLVFGIPNPVGGCTLHVAMGDEDVTVTIAEAKIAKWGKSVNVEGIDLTSVNVIGQPDLDNELYDVITNLLHSFFYKEI